jgi:hypothetical protein
MNKYVYLNLSDRRIIYYDSDLYFPYFVLEKYNKILKNYNPQTIDILKKISRIDYPRNF